MTALLIGTGMFAFVSDIQIVKNEGKVKRQPKDSEQSKPQRVAWMFVANYDLQYNG